MLYKPTQVPSESESQDRLSSEDLALQRSDGRLALYTAHPPKILNESAIASLTLQRPLKTSREGSAQSWTGTVSPFAGGHSDSHSFPQGPLVAKFYDPVHYTDDDLCTTDNLRDMEGAAYCELESYRKLRDVQGKVVPLYYGLFLCNIEHQNRAVWVSLIEYIDGASLYDAMYLQSHQIADTLNHTRLDDAAGGWTCTAHATKLVDGILAAKEAIARSGVNHMDFQLRNIIVCKQNAVHSTQWPFCDDRCFMVDMQMSIT